MNLPKTSIAIAFILFLKVFVCRCQKLEGNVYPNNGICSSIDVRNTPAAFEVLRNCSIIAGYLQIVLLEGHSEKSYLNLSFPELREVTQFVLVYRVHGLPSLGLLFPNLALIRGEKLVLNYALVIYECPQLQEVGLKSLTTILRGTVRMERNYQLCYSQTVSWEKITGSASGHYFSGNGPEMCPGKESCRGCDDNLCWSSKNCQRFPSTSCHPECLGGCDPIGGLCYRCKHFIDDNTCVETCPSNKFEFRPAFTCLTRAACRRMYRGRGWIWGKKCIVNCPKGYVVKIVNKTKACVPCDRCDSVCDGIEIGSIADAQMLKGCVYVNGSLGIKMQGEHSVDIMKELEESLGSIEEIWGYLTVYRSLPLTSLSFLKNLTIIHGNELEQNRFAISVYEMSNLQYLWNWKSKKNLTIANGTVSFHNNDKLCLKEIDQLMKVTNINASLAAVSLDSNGFKVACQVTILETESHVIDTRNATITWQRVSQNSTNQTILGYLVYYLEDPEDDVITDFARDLCYDHMWKSIFVDEPSTPEPRRLTQNLTNLQPSTKYAFYIETYSGSVVSYISDNSFTDNGQSIIKFFTTKMNHPSRPFDVRTVSMSEDSITVYWTKDPEYRGNITRYIIEIYIEPDDVNYLDMRNYCFNPLKLYQTTRHINTTQNETDISTQDECHCGQTDSFWDKYIENETSSIEFFSEVGIKMECKKTDKPSETVPDILNEIRCSPNDYVVTEDEEMNQTKEKRHADNFRIPNEMDHEPTQRATLENVTHEGRFHYFSTDFLSHHKNYTLHNLKHFTKYVIFLAGCKGPKDTDCGSVSMSIERTLHDDTADNIVDLSYVVLNNSAAEVTWREPKNPNGVTLSYTVEYKKLEIVNFKPVFECITRLQHEKNKYKHILHHLLPGAYSVRVRATSLAGDGNFTEPQIFNIPEHNYNFNWSLFFGLGVAATVVLAALGFYFQKRNIPCRIDEHSLIGHVEYCGVRYTHNGDEGSVELLEID